MPERTFIRRSKNATDNTLSEYIQWLKLELAKERPKNNGWALKNFVTRQGTKTKYKKQFTFFIGEMTGLLANSKLQDEKES